MSTDVEAKAREANNPDQWDDLWDSEGEESWRKDMMGEVYDRILMLIPEGSDVIDIGGGRGFLAEQLRDVRGCTVEVWDISAVATNACKAKGIPARIVDLEQEELPTLAPETIVVSTECIEHLSEGTRDRLFAWAKNNRIFFSVPNDCLGPDVEPQHTVQYTAMSFKTHLKKHFEHVRIEVQGPCKAPFIGRYLLGVGGFKKNFTLSFTMPVRNEEKDIERVLASFRAAADEIVIGIDFRSTDRTREIARKYADVVFEIEDPQGPPDDLAPQVHFSWIRNKCMDRCTGDWIFMSEGHESLKKGTDTLLQLDKAFDPGTKYAYVWRTGQGQRWAFPWLTSGRDTRFRYTRQTHNDLHRPDDALFAKMPQVETWHFRDHAASEARKAQRKVQNRVTLMDDWMVRRSEHSLWHLASEWREFDSGKALSFYEEFLALDSKNGDACYQARLIIAKEHALAGLKSRDEAVAYGKAGKAKEAAESQAEFNSRFALARKALIPATGHNWSRTEHWMSLGDLAAEQEWWEEALQFYKYGATQIGNPPFVLWWIDDCVYSYLPAQRLAMTYSALGRYSEALAWAQRVTELLPEETPEELVNEAKANVTALEEALNG